jgi:RimJ/RimL family protein N-acetyltransferase
MASDDRRPVEIEVGMRTFDEERDLPSLMRFRSDRDSTARMFGWVRPAETRQQVVEWVEWFRGAGHLWTFTEGGDEPLGLAAVFHVDKLNRTLWTGTSIYDPGRRRRGLGTAARRCLLSHIFYELDYRRVFGQFVDFNVASWRSHQKLGAEIVGRRRRMCILSGRYHDFVQYVYRQEAFTSRVAPPPRTWEDVDATLPGGKPS